MSSLIQEHKEVPRVERRTSPRLRKDLVMTTDDKTMMMGQKRNLEGTNLNPENSFSVLADDDIMQLSLNMGIQLNESNFAAIDLVKDLEIASHSLAEKIVPPESNTEKEPILVVVEEEFSDIEMYDDQLPKRRGRPKTGSLFLAQKKVPRTREALVPKKPRVEIKETLTPLWWTKPKKEVGKNERPNLEL